MGGVVFFFVVLFLLFGGFGVVGQFFGLFFGLFGGLFGLVGGLIGLFFAFLFTVLPFLILLKFLSAIFGGLHQKQVWVCTDHHSPRHPLEDEFYGDKRKNEDKRKRDLYYRDPQDPYQQDIRIV